MFHYLIFSPKVAISKLVFVSLVRHSTSTNTSFFLLGNFTLYFLPFIIKVFTLAIISSFRSEWKMQSNSCFCVLDLLLCLLPQRIHTFDYTPLYIFKSSLTIASFPNSLRHFLSLKKNAWWLYKHFGYVWSSPSLFSKILFPYSFLDPLQIGKNPEKCFIRWFHGYVNIIENTCTY
jgi:hypothetical protein